MKIQLKQIVDEGWMAPKWYGLAYRDYFHKQAVCYPIPLNVLVRVWKNLCWKLDEGMVQSRREEQLRAAKRAGYEDGYVRGYRKAKREIDRKLENLGYLSLDELLRSMEKMRQCGWGASRRNDE